MSEPIVFVSHFQVIEGKLDGFKQFFKAGAKLLEAEKPRTLAFLAYINGDGTRVTIAHAFADAESMDLHVQGADARSRAAYQFLKPEGIEIHGAPSQPVLEMMRGAAASGPALRVQPESVGGFLRLG